MLAQLSQWLMIAAIGQAAPEQALLKSAPAEVDVAVRVRGIEAGRNDLVAMVKAVDPEWGNMVEGMIAGGLAQFSERHGAHAARTPFLGLIRLDDVGADGHPGFAVLVPSDDYKGTIKELSGGKDVELKHQDGDFDAFDSPDGNGSWYAAKGEGFVAFGPSKGLVARVAKKGGKTLDSVLTGTAGKRFAAGDVGIYVNARTLTNRYGDQIEQGRQSFMGALDQAGQQGGNAQMMQSVKEMYGKLFDSLKYAEALTIDVDFAEKGLHLAGYLGVKDEGGGARAAAAARTDRGSQAMLGKLPADATVYTYMNLDSKIFQRLQNLSLSMLTPEGQTTPAIEKARAQLAAIGPIEATGSATIGRGMTSVGEVFVDHPRAYIDATIATIQSLKGGDGRPGIYKDVKVEPDVQVAGGMKFTRVEVVMDREGLSKLSGGDPKQQQMMKSLFGSEPLVYWYGTDNKRMVQLIAPTWEAARSLLETYTSGKGRVGESAGFKAVSTELPERASVLMIMNVQSLIKMMASGVGAMTNQPDVKPPDDMPKEPAFVGFSLTPHASSGYEFHFVVPSTAATTVVKGVVPMFQGLAGGARP